MNNYEKWAKENVRPEVVWVHITNGDYREPCKVCPAKEYCEKSEECCYKSFMKWAKEDSDQ